MNLAKFEGSVNPFDLVFNHRGKEYSIEVTTDNLTFTMTSVSIIDKEEHYFVGTYEYTLSAIHLTKKYKRLLQL